MNLSVERVTTESSALMKTEFDMEISNLPAELYGNLIQQKIRDSIMPWQLAEHWAYISTELC